MRISGLCLICVFLISTLLLAQHTTAGGSSSSSTSSASSSASSGGGGSHSSSSIGSSSSVSSGGSHSSGSSSAGSPAHSSPGGGHSSSAATPSHSGPIPNSGSGAVPAHSDLRSSKSDIERSSIREPKFGAPVKTAPPEKRTFFSYLRHPFHKVQAVRAPIVPRPICWRGHCTVCPPNGVNGGYGCVNSTPTNNSCSRLDVWNGGSCLLQTRFLADCGG